MIGKGATPSFFAIANDNYTLTTYSTNINHHAIRMSVNTSLIFAINKMTTPHASNIM